jgi:hypothetical protein
MKKGSIRKDFSGQKFNRLTAIKRSDRQYPNGNYYWWFKCDCGNEKEILPSNVVKVGGGVVSCGCVQKARHHGKAWLTSMIYDYIKHAEKLGVTYSLSRNKFESLIQQKCFYCGDSSRNGIDRVNPLEGYTLDNCVPCCKVCNYMKRTMTAEEFIVHIKKIVAMCIVAAVA